MQQYLAMRQLKKIRPRYERNGHHALCSSPVSGVIVTGVELRVAKVNETLSRLVVLQAKQKPRILHRNKRYVVWHKCDSEWSSLLRRSLQ